MKTKYVAYISGPYRSTEGINGIQENITRARNVATKYWRKGYAVICPHMNSAMMDGIMMRGWECSVGSVVEHDLALKLHMKIEYE